MNSTVCKTQPRGFTLIELMVGMVVGLLISAVAVSAFLTHSRTVYQQMSYNQASEDISEAFAVLSRLVIQAQRDSVVVATTVSDTVLTATTISLELPVGFPAWPNIDDTTSPPFNENHVLIAWSSTGDNANQITVANAASSGGLAGATAQVFAGGASGNNTRFTSLNLVSDGGDPASYTFSISGKDYARDQVDGNDSSTGITVEGGILPRN